MILYLVRHGDLIANPDSLTPLGERQAEAVGRRLAMVGLDRIYSSSSNRAIQTATPAAEMTKKKITVLDWCNEKYIAEQLTVHRDGKKVGGFLFENPETRLQLNSPAVRALGDRWYEAFPQTPYEEGIRRIQTESDAFLLSLGYRHDRENAC